MIQLLQVGLIGMYISPEIFGLYATSLTFISIVTIIADGGFYSYISSRQQLSFENFKVIRSIAMKLGLLLLFLSVIIAATVYFISHEKRYSNLLIMLSPYPLFICLGQVNNGIFAKERRFDLIAKIDIISNIGSLFSFCLLLFFGYQIESLLISFILGGALRLVLAQLFFSKSISEFTFVPVCSIDNLREYSVFTTFERGINYIDSNVDKIFIAISLSARDVGLYSQVFQIVSKPVAIVNPIFTKAMVPMLAIKTANNEELGKGYLEWVRIIALFTLPFFLFIEYTADSLFQTFFHKSWVVGSSSLLGLFSVLGFFWTIGNPLGVLINVKLESRKGFYFALFSLITHVLLLFIFNYYGWSVVNILYALILTAVINALVEFYLRRKIIHMRAISYLSSMSLITLSYFIPLLFHKFFLRDVIEFKSSVMHFFLAVLFFWLTNLLFDLKMRNRVTHIFMEFKEKYNI